MKNLVIILSLLILLFFSRITQAQTLKLGFRIEPAMFMTEQKNESTVSFTFISGYLSLSLEPVEWIGLEARPGYLVGGEYGGFEIGAFLRLRVLPSNFFIIAGINHHSNDILDSHNTGGNYQKQMLFQGVGIGYQKDSKLGIDLTYYWTNDKVFAYSYNGSTKTDKLMSGIIKLGFSLAWNIL